MQARTAWRPPTGPLGRLTRQAHERAAVLGNERSWQARAADSPEVTSFRASLANGPVAVIAEVKRKSPSKGELNISIDAGERARLYESGGASALSILTEPAEFGGSLHDLRSARASTRLPLLRKDFHVHPVQLFEARVNAASAALLIVRGLGPDDTRVMADAAAEAGIEAVFEVRDDTELTWALDAGAAIIGVNRRNLETLLMEDGVVERLLPIIPARLIAIAESGVSTRTDVERAAESGVDAVLVGSALSVSPDPRQAVANLTGVARSGVRG